MGWECYNPQVPQRPEHPQTSLRRSRLRLILLFAIAVLYVASIPWYRSADAPLRLWFGLPDWVAVALLCYLAAGVLNAWAWWITDVSDPPPHPTAPTDARERQP